jgi:hypothetical protein
MSRSQSVQLRPNSGSTVSTTIVLEGTDGEPIDLKGIDPITVSLIDVSPELGTPTIIVGNVGNILVSIPWDSDRVNGQVYRFRVRYYFEGDDIVYTTPLFEVIYQ